MIQITDIQINDIITSDIVHIHDTIISLCESQFFFQATRTETLRFISGPDDIFPAQTFQALFYNNSVECKNDCHFFKLV
jgi:hypothetical protein